MVTALRRAALLGALVVMAVPAVASSLGAAASSDVLNGHGSFEKPVIIGNAKLYAPGTSFDGWRVKIAKVAMGPGLAGFVAPPQGKQFLSIANPFNGKKAGEVCRSIASVAGHHYSVVFLAAVVANGSSRIVIKIGSASSRTKPIAASFPAAWKSYALKLTSPTANAQFCITAENAPPAAYPAIDRVTVHDLG
jgi:hypothetical protein